MRYKILSIILLILLIGNSSYSQDVIIPPITFEEEDGSPSITTPYKLKVTNGTLTDNADGTASLANVGTEADTLDTVCDRGASTDQTPLFAADTDVTAQIGRMKLGNPIPAYADYAGWAHFDHASLTNYAMLQDNVGLTIINAVLGQSISFRINNAELANLSATTFDLGGTVTLDDANHSPDAVGEFLYDNTITGLDDGGLAWYDDDEIRILIDLDASETLEAGDDTHVVTFNWNGGSGYFDLQADDTGAGGGDPVLVDTTAITDASGVDLTSGTYVGITLNTGVSPDTATFDINAGTLVDACMANDALDPDKIIGDTGDDNLLAHEIGGIEADISAITDGDILVGTGAGTMAIRANVLTAGAAGYIKHELGGLETDISGYGNGLFGTTGTTTVDIDTEAELETALGGLDVVCISAGDITKANLETATNDVSDYAEADGDTWTGNHDFSGATLTGGIKQRVYISACAGVPRTTNGCADAALSETTTNKVNYYTCDFDASSDEFWQFHFTLPENYDGGTFTYAVSWTCTADGAKGVAWFLQLMSITDDDALDTAYGTAVESNDDGTATGDYLLSPESAAVTASGTPLGGHELWGQLYRDVSDADDDLTTDAKFIGLWLIFGKDALSTED